MSHAPNAQFPLLGMGSDQRGLERHAGASAAARLRSGGSIVIESQSQHALIRRARLGQLIGAVSKSRKRVGRASSTINDA